MNLLLAQVGNWILLGVLVLFLVVSPFLMKAKNKREMESAQKMVDSLKKGDTVLTASGVIGKIVGMDTKNGYKTVTIETGDQKHKGYITLDVAAVYANLSNPTPTVESKPSEETKTEEVVAEQSEEKSAEDEEVVIENSESAENVEKSETKQAQPKKKSKKSTNKSKK